ncbi:MAG: histidine kinase [Pseudomonadota bacterium]
MFKTDETRQAAWLTLGVWLLSGVLFSATHALVNESMTGRVLATVLAMNLFGSLASIGLYQAALRTRHRPALIRVATIAAAAVAAAAFLGFVDVALMDLIRRVFEPDGKLSSVPIWIRACVNIVAFIWIFGMLGAIYLTLQANWTVRERELQLAAARTAASEANAAASAARLAALRYQLNPHFLFNTLNAVSAAVITHRTDEAESMLSKLADFLRVTLVTDPEAMIPLEDELATLQAYLEIESVRFRERLALEFVCPDDLRGALIPSFLLQPLIENAIKHGVAPTSETVTIRLEINRNAEDLVILVQDDGEGGDGEVRPGAGLGLRNIRLRLDTLYGPRGTLQATPLARGFLAMIRLPLQWPSAKPLSQAA